MRGFCDMRILVMSTYKVYRDSPEAAWMPMHCH